MLSFDLSSKLMQLPLNKIKIVEEDMSREGEGIICLKIRRKTKYAYCPHCRRKTKKQYDSSKYLQKGVKHFTTFKYELTLDLIKRRFWCSKCQKNFQEQYEFVPYKIAPDKKIRSKAHTKTFEEYVLFEWASTTVAEIARRSKVSEYRIWSIIGEIDMEALKRRGVEYMLNYDGDLFLGIDEHSFSGKDMVLVITEHSTKKVVAILPSISKIELTKWLNNLPPKVMKKIKGLTIDMTNNYKSAVLKALGAHVVDIVDKYHVIQLANKVVDEVRQLNNWMIHMGHYGHNIVDIQQKKGISKPTQKKPKERLSANEKLSANKYRPLEVRRFAQEKSIRTYRPEDPNYTPITVEHFIDEKYRLLFLTGEEKLSEKQKHRLNQIFMEFDPQGYLFESYNAKEKIRECLNKKDEALLDEVITDLEKSEHYRLKTLCLTLKNQRQSILNYFKYGLTNARLEGKNNKAKVMKRISYGYNTKENYMKKLLFAL